MEKVMPRPAKKRKKPSFSTFFLPFPFLHKKDTSLTYANVYTKLHRGLWVVADHQIISAYTIRGNCIMIKDYRRNGIQYIDNS